MRLGQSEFSTKYHDEEWGIPIHDDIKLFEMLVLEWMQEWLSWETNNRRKVD